MCLTDYADDAEQYYPPDTCYYPQQDQEDVDEAVEEEVEKIASRSCNNSQSDKINSFLLEMRSALTKNSMSPFGVSQHGKH